jgi:DNA-directed RNA polymerase specialized sigma24 family protein
VIDIIRRNQTKARLITSGDDVLMEMQPDENSNPHEKYEAEHRFQVVRDALSNLKTQRANKEYEIFCDMYLRDMSKEELMAKYKTSASGVYLAKHRVMKKLKAEINRLSIH